MLFPDSKHMLRCTLIVFSWFVLITPSAIGRDSVPRLTVLGRVEGIQLRRTDPHYVDCKIQLILEFVNRDAEPIIILRPTDESSAQPFFLGGVTLAKSRADAEAGQNIYDLQAWPSVDLSPAWKGLARDLDEQIPPPALTRVLQPNETWTWSTTTGFRFFYKAWNQDLGWDQIREIKNPLWLRLSIGMWPHNLERASSGIGKKLRHRWEKVGRLWLDPTSAHGILISEPMLMKLSESKLIESK